MELPMVPLRSRLSRSALGLLAGLAVPALVLAGCKDSNAFDVEFTVTPDEVTLFAGETVQLTAVGAPGALLWSSTNSSVATVIAETGYVQAISRGEATISAVSGSSVASATINVLAPPALALSAPSVTFEKDLGQAADPPTQTINVTNAGDGSINDIALGTIAYGEGQPRGWLTATASGSTAPITITLRARDISFPRGTYTASLPIVAQGIDNSPQNVAVTFRVMAPAALALSRTTVPMASIPNTTVQEAVQITNDGDRPLTGLATSIAYQTGQSGWLTAALSATSAPSTLTLTANTTGLAVGSYSATVTVTSTVAGVTSRSINVELVVSPGPAIVVSATNVIVQAVIGTNPAPRVLQITNGGGGTLSNLALDAVQYAQGQPANWLNPVLGSATAPTTLTLNITSAALATGTYNATLAIRSSVASNSPLTLSVNLNVGPPPNIAVSPSTLTFATWGNAPSQFLPGAQVVSITNSGGGTLSGLQVTTDGSFWLANPVFVGGNTTAPTQLQIRPDSAALNAGTYTATVTVSAPGVTPRTITVTYVIQTFSNNLYPAFGSAGCSGCHFGTQPPNMSGTAQSVHTAVSAYIVPGSPATSQLVCKIITNTVPCAHSGGKFPGLAGIVDSWIRAGAPFR